METRRELIKSGMGLAAIIAAGKAPAAVVRSMIAGRQMVINNGGGGWVNPYVTDGLVGMWDGEWNAGPGVHDPNVTTWADLSGNGYNGVIGSAVVVGSDNMAFDGTQSINDCVQLGSDWFGKPSEITFECVFASDGGASAMQSPFGGVEGLCSGLAVYVSSTVYLSFITTGASSMQNMTFWNKNVRNTGIPHSVSLVVGQGGIKTYHNGVVYESAAGGTLDWTNRLRNAFIGADPFNPTEFHLNGRVFCVRLSSTPFSDAQVAANYAVDKARFGLPD